LQQQDKQGGIKYIKQCDFSERVKKRLYYFNGTDFKITRLNRRIPFAEKHLTANERTGQQVSSALLQ
jgi:hypothetical protein